MSEIEKLEFSISSPGNLGMQTHGGSEVGT